MTVVQLPRQSRRDFARAVPETIDPDKRTVEIVWTTGATVRRRGLWNDESFDEELSLEAGHVRMDRLNGGAPLLDTHGTWALQDVIGVVEKAWISDNGDRREGRAVVRFSEREDVEPIWRDVQSGIIRNVSVGYQVHKFEKTGRDGQVPLMRAVDWEPMELSLVPVGADAAAGVRTQGEASPCEIVTTESTGMDQPNNGQPGPAGTEATRAAAAAEEARIRTEAAADERKRAAEIRKRCGTVGLDGTFADGLVERGVAIDRVGDEIVDELARRGGGAGARGPRVEGGFDATEPVARREAMATALAARHSPGVVRMDEGSRAASFRGLSILDMAVEHLNLPARGLSRMDIAKRALATTSDFPLMLESALNKTLLAAYELASPTFKQWAAQRSFKDFRAHSFFRAGDFPDLEQNAESAPITVSAPGDASKESVSLYKYGRRISLSREVLINDDLGGFMDVGRMAGRRIADKENALVYAQLALNTFSGPTLRDTYAVFQAANHANKAASGTAIDVTNVAAGRAAMMKQTSAGGLKLNIVPQILLTGPDKQTQAEVFLNSVIVAATDANANPFKGKMKPVADANITGNYWFLFADPNVAPVFIYGYLEDMAGPRIETQEGWSTDGVEYRAMLYFGTGAIDYRGGYQNAGA